jgi:DNA helicase-2/ATP-dependent DNA helicase PcrA
MTNETLIFGPPGCGKTYTLINLIKEELARGTPPDRIGFVSFSKKSIEEARARAGSELGLTEKDLPWFRTLHSIGHRWLGYNHEDLMGAYDYNMLGSDLGMIFDSNTARSFEDGLIPMSTKEGNKYLEIIARSAMRCISLEEEFNDRADYSLYWENVEYIANAYKSYKVHNAKHDYTDMVQQFVKQGTGPSLDVLIVDEAQDLTPLQWEQVYVLKQNAERIWYAGDDDQCIHRWNGVEVSNFMNACDNKQVLNQSYRVPKKVFDLANSVVQRIGYRQDKTWNPMEREGDIQWHASWYDVDIDQGSWTIMGRTNQIISKVAAQLRNDGHLFRMYDRLSINEELMQAMAIWTRMAKGEGVSLEDVRKLYKQVPKQGSRAVVKRGAIKSLDAVDPQAMYKYEDLVRDHGMLSQQSTSSEDIVNMSDDDRTYLAAIKRRGDMEARISLSTIHRMKGGEDDNIMLFTESCYPAVNNPEQDDEHRVFYTGITRTKHNLHIVDPECRYRYQI